MTINVTLMIRMTRQEVDRDIVPTLDKPPDAYFYWWNHSLMMKWMDIDIPVILTKENMLVEVVDEKNLYDAPVECNCPLCTMSDEELDALTKIFDR